MAPSGAERGPRLGADQDCCCSAATLCEVLNEEFQAIYRLKQRTCFTSCTLGCSRICEFVSSLTAHLTGSTSTQLDQGSLRCLFTNHICALPQTSKRRKRCGQGLKWRDVSVSRAETKRGKPIRVARESTANPSAAGAAPQGRAARSPTR